MRRFRALITALMLTLVTLSPVSAENRIQWPYAIQPPSQWMNMQSLDPYVGLGQLIWDIVGRSNTSGFFTNSQISANGGLYVTITPVVSNSYASLYQTGVTDVNPYGSGSGQLSADPTQIFHQALTNSTANSVGPLVAATTSGQSIDYLVECQAQINDTTTQTVNFVSNTNVASTGSATRDRADQWYCQSKASSQGTSPTVPSVDSGWVALGFVNVPFGTSTIAGGNITTYQNWLGFIPAGSAQTFMDLSTNQTAAGNKTFSGNTSMNLLGFTSTTPTLGNLPQIASDSQGSPGMLLNVATGSNGVQFEVDGAMSGAHVNTSGTYYTGTSYLAATGLNVNGSASVNGATFDGTTLTSNSGGGYLALNAGATGNAVRVNYNNSSSTGLKVFDGGASNYGLMTATGLSFSGASTSAYSSTDATVYGNVIMPNQTAGNCAQFDGSHHLVAASGPCGLASGTLTSVVGTSPITASVSSGSATVGIINSPTWVGASTTHGGYVYTSDAAVSYNVYVGTTSGSETLQNVSPITIGTGWTEPSSGLVAGASLPTLDRSGYLGVPTAPSTGSTSGGSISATTYYVKVTYVNAAGETLASGETTQAVTASHELTVTSPGTSTPANSTAVQAFGSDEAYGISRSGGAFSMVALAGGSAPTLEDDGGFISGSSSYFPTYASINGNLSANKGTFAQNVVAVAANSQPTFSDGGANATTAGTAYFMAFGGTNAASDILAYPCTGTSSAPCYMTSGGDTISTVISDMFELKAGTTPVIGIDHSGNVGIGSTAAFKAGSSIYAATSETVNGASQATQYTATGTGFVAGSATYGPSIATVPNSVNVNNATGSYQLNGAAVLTSDSNSLYLRPETSSGCDYLENSGGTNLLHICTAGNLILDQSGNMVTGSSTYGATVATVAGAITGNGLVSNNGVTSASTVFEGTSGTAGGSTDAYQWGAATSACSSGHVSLVAGTTSFSGVTDNLAFLGCDGSSDGMAVDSAGDVGLTGNLHLGGSGNVLIGTSSPIAQIGQPGSGTSVDGINCTLVGVAQQSTAWKSCMDTSGDLGILGSFDSGVVEANYTTSGLCVMIGSSSHTNCSTNGNNGAAIQFANADGASYSSFIGSNSTISVAGIGCNDLIMGQWNGSSSANDFCIDSSGNLGVRGSVFEGSRRALKRNIVTLTVDPFDVLPRDWVSYCYKSDPKCMTHYGFIADDTNVILAGPNHDHFDVNALATIDGMAVQQLNKRVKALEHPNPLGIIVHGTTYDPRVDALQRQVASLWETMLGLGVIVLLLFCCVIYLLVRND